MTLQRVSFAVPTGEIEGVLHLPETTTLGGCAVLHGFGGHPDQPHIVATCAALAEAGIAALRFAYRDHQPPRMTLGSALEDAAGAIRLLKAHPSVPEQLGVVGFSFGGAVAIQVGAVLGTHCRGVITLSTQSAGCEVAAELGETPLLLLHGTNDELLPPETSTVVQMLAGHGEVVLLPGAGHLLSEAAGELRERIDAWIGERFAGA